MGGGWWWSWVLCRGWASQNCFDQCELANSVPLMLFWLSREAIASPSSTNDAYLCTCAKERRECHLPLREHGHFGEKMTRLQSCHSFPYTKRSQQAFLIKWIISDTSRSFMESEKFYAGAVIKAEMYCHWLVNLIVAFEIIFIWKWTTMQTYQERSVLQSAYLRVLEYASYRRNPVAW